MGPEAQRPVVAPSWLAWCSFSLRASNRLHFSTTFRLGCGGGLILAGEASLIRSPQPGHFYGLRSRLCTGARRHPWFAWACATGGSLTACIFLVPANRCPGPTTHRLSMQKSFWGCDPCRLLSASHDANLASWRGDLAASLALSGSRFAVRSGCSHILMLSQKSFNCATPRPDLAKFGSGSELAPPL